MSINVIRFKYQGVEQWGVVRDGQITPVPGEFPTTGAFLSAHGIETLASLRGSPIAEEAVELLSPVTENQQFLCQGANYRQHMIESGMNPDEKRFNMIFTKAASCMAPANCDVVRPKKVRFLDYEIELGLVLKRDITSACTVRDDNLHEFVAGLVIVNDYSARDVQIPEMQFYKGKSYRTFGPIGPYLCLLERGEIGKLYDMNLTLTVNGVVRQRDTTRNLVNRPPETISELSGVHNMAAGDLIATGTPSGCALSIPSPLKQKIAAALPESVKWKMFMKIQAKREQYLKPGDRVEARIASADGKIDLGTQRNRIVGGV
ncbi:MAG TPA: fumarylacetoacetate hydrolase family protein [Rhizobium sp.]|nr:fumarylacetoacetate hydrolase family protein [Rhizobium sp.]